MSAECIENPICGGAHVDKGQVVNDRDGYCSG